MSPSEIASRLLLPTQQHYHSDLPNRLECLLRLLASYYLLTDEDGSTMRFYAISPSSKYFVHDENGGGYPTSFTSFLCHPVLNFKEVVIDPEIDLSKKVHGMSKFEYFGKEPKINHVCKKAMNDNAQPIYEGISTLVDVGGGTGKCLKLIIDWAFTV
ncbi:Isoliquiritigenin 2'-O-methyltransferase [Glycine max]|nr:Isoliquiritigenin 2'-O-methyltransferase [Glycine max]